MHVSDIMWVSIQWTFCKENQRKELTWIQSPFREGMGWSMKWDNIYRERSPDNLNLLHRLIECLDLPKRNTACTVKSTYHEGRASDNVSATQLCRSGRLEHARNRYPAKAHGLSVGFCCKLKVLPIFSIYRYCDARIKKSIGDFCWGAKGNYNHKRKCWGIGISNRNAF